jgi:hypothetical protein
MLSPPADQANPDSSVTCDVAERGDSPDDVPWHGAPEEPAPEEEQPAKEPEEIDPELEFATKWEDRLTPATVPVPFVRKRGGLPSWLRLVLVLAFVAVLVVPAWLFTRWLTAPKLGTAGWLLPDQTESLLIIDVASLRKSEAYWALLKSAPPLLVALQRMPVQPENINRLILTETGDGSILTIIQTKEPLRAEQLKQRIKADNLVQEEVGRYVAHCDARGRGLCLVQSDLIAIGQLPLLKQVLLRSQPAQLPAAMRQAVDQLNLSHTVVLIATPQARAGLGLPGGLNVKRLSLEVDVSEQVDAALVIECPRAEDAEELQKRMRELLGKELPPGKETEALSKALDIAVDGTTLTGQLHIEANTFVVALGHILGLRQP